MNRKLIFMILTAIFFGNSIISMENIRQQLSPSAIRLIGSLINSASIDMVKKQMFQLFAQLPPELKNRILIDIMKEELAQEWTKEDLKNKINKFLLAYLPAQTEITDENGAVLGKEYVLDEAQMRFFLEQLDYKVIAITKKPWTISPTFLVTMFYHGEDKQNLLSAIKNKTISSELLKKDLSNRFLPHRNRLFYNYLIGEVVVDNTHLLVKEGSYKKLFLEGFLEITKHPEEIKEIRFNNTYSPILSAEIGAFTNLQTLSLENNQLIALPSEIGNLTQLKQLDLAGNQLSSLPPEIGNLINLDYLGLNDNQLSSLPPEIRKLIKLHWLDLSNNQLDDSLDITLFANLPPNAELILPGNKFSPEKKEEIKRALPQVKVEF